MNKIFIVILATIEMLIAMNLSILFHEVGHFTMARILNMKVSEFEVGTGKKMFSFTINKTHFIFNNLFKLDNLKNGGSISAHCIIDKDDFINASKFSKVLVMLGGAFSYLICSIVFIYLYLKTKNSFFLSLVVVNVLWFLYFFVPRDNSDFKVILDILNNKFKLD